MAETTTNGEREHDERVLKARMHIQAVAAGLAVTIGPADTAFTLAGAAMAVYAATYGRDKAAAFLRELADEVQTDSEIDGGAGRA
jgi:sugar (pentulose or hexulose) kinase